jgi:branched-chain amino acid aminotransferase
MAQLRRIAVARPGSDGLYQFVFPVEQGSLDVHSNYSHAAKYGNGGFTGERCTTHRAGPHAGRPVWFRLADHERRLEATIDAVEWLTVISAADRIDARMRLAAMNRDDCYFSVYFGSEGDVGVMPKEHRAIVLINSRDMDPFTKPYLPLDVVRHGMTVMLIDDPELRRGPFSKYSRAKLSRNYLFSNVAKHRASINGAHDALMLDESGNFSELTVSNLILLTDDGLETPAAESSALNGITKQTIMTIASEKFRVPCSEQRLTVDDLSRTNEAFATGTAIGIIRINRIVDVDGRTIWSSAATPGHLIDHLRDFYWGVLYGEQWNFHPEWYTPVPRDILSLPEPLVAP